MSSDVGNGILSGILGAPLPALDASAFFLSAEVVVDANVLLGLYRYTRDSRNDLLGVLEAVSQRLWIPHQVAAEFSRNRLKVLIDRQIYISDLNKALEGALTKSVSSIAAAVDAVVRFRESSATLVDWNLGECGLDANSVRNSINGLIDPIRSELSRLKSEHDLQIKDVTDPSRDHVLQKLTELVKGRVGDPYSADELRNVVSEAIDFRYPNKLPPGYEDVKDTEVRTAGDYVLWRQTLDHVRDEPPESGLVLFVTGDVKHDWWHVDNERNPVQPRTELLYEFAAVTGKQLYIVTPREFLAGANSYLGGAVSERTLSEVDAVGREADDTSTHLEDHALQPQPSSRLTIIGLRDALEQNGYTAEAFGHADRGFPLGLVATDRLGDRAGVFLDPDEGYKRSARRLQAGMIASDVSIGVLVSARLYRPQVFNLAAQRGIRIMLRRVFLDFVESGAAFSEVRAWLAERVSMLDAISDG